MCWVVLVVLWHATPFGHCKNARPGMRVPVPWTPNGNYLYITVLLCRFIIFRMNVRGFEGGYGLVLVKQILLYRTNIGNRDVHCSKGPGLHSKSSSSHTLISLPFLDLHTIYQGHYECYEHPSYV